MPTSIDLGKSVRNMRRRVLKQPEYFFNEVMQTELLPWQMEMINAVLDIQRLQKGIPTVTNHNGLQRISIVSGHGTGKTFGLAALCHVWNFINYGLVAITAPKQDQVKTRFFYRYKRLLHSAVPWYSRVIKCNTMDACIGGDVTWGVQGETASDPNNLAGYHDTPQLFLVDEGSSKRLDPMYPVIEGALTTPGSVLVEISNPTRIVGEFATHHLRKGVKELYYRMHIGPQDAPKLIDQKWVDYMAKKYGAESPIYKVRVQGLFVDAGERQLVALSWLNEARDSGEDFKPDGSIPQLRISADVADGGIDLSTITAGLKYDSGLLVKRKRSYSFPSAESPIRVADAMEQMFHEFGGNKANDLMIVDGIGVGAGTAGTLIARGYNVVRFIGGASAANPKRFRNRRVQGHIALRDDLRDARIFFGPDFVTSEDEWDEFCQQVVSVQTKPGTERVEDIETKEEYKAREGKSPDQLESVMMQLATDVPLVSRGEGNMVFETFGQMETAHADW